MCKTAKAQLAKALMSIVQPSECNTQIHHVLVGSALIHGVKWLKGATYREIAKSYVSYVHQHYFHAWSGHDTTSATFGHGKTSLLKRIKESKEIQQISSLMSEHSATAEQIDKAGTRLYVTTYGGRQEDSLNGLRYIKFMEMVSSSKASLDPQKLPPTERAAHYHSLRVHLQVIIWKELSNNILDPKKWVGNLKDQYLHQ